MTDTKKEQERAELHRVIWNIANDLRGSVDGWDFKQYVLGMLFYRYISENLAGYINRGEWEAGNTEFDYTALSDAEAEEARAGLVEEKGFFILPSELNGNWLCSWGWCCLPSANRCGCSAASYHRGCGQRLRKRKRRTYRCGILQKI